MNLKAFLACLGIMLVFPYAMVVVIPENIREAWLVEVAPRHRATVTGNWAKRINPQTDGYWIRFQEPVANTPVE